MWRRRRRVLRAKVGAVGLFITAFGTSAWAGPDAGPLFQGLGHLSHSLGSLAQDVSADGSVIIGVANSMEGPQAFRWTADEGMVALGDLPGGEFISAAFGVSRNGGVVVGWSASSSGPEQADVPNATIDKPTAPAMARRTVRRRLDMGPLLLPHLNTQAGSWPARTAPTN